MEKQIIRSRFSVSMAALPKYLSQQARKGLFFKNLNAFWLCFEKGEPQNLDYKLVPINNDDEYEQIKNLEGWTIVRIKWGLAIICAPENTPFILPQDHKILMMKLSYMRTMYLIRFLIAVSGLAFSLTAVSQWRGNKFMFTLAIVLSVLLFGFAFFELYPLLRLQMSIRNMQKAKGE